MQEELTCSEFCSLCFLRWLLKIFSFYIELWEIKCKMEKYWLDYINFGHTQLMLTWKKDQMFWGSKAPQENAVFLGFALTASSLFYLKAKYSWTTFYSPHFCCIFHQFMDQAMDGEYSTPQGKVVQVWLCKMVFIHNGSEIHQ